MSRSDDGKCPDVGCFCACIREWCEGDCEVLRDERKAKAFAMVREIAEQMRYHAKINRRCDERNNTCTCLSIEADMYDEYANQLDEAIKEFVKGEPNA